MRRRDALIIGGAFAAALAVPPILRGRDDPFEFTSVNGLPGFRRLDRDQYSGGVDMFAGILTDDEIDAAARLPDNLCDAIFPEPVPEGVTPIAVFSDYYCPYCAVLDRRLADLSKEGASTQLRFHELPLLGSRSVAAARVALAASVQGDHTAIHLDMMQRVLRPGAAGIRDLAERHGLDAARLAEDAASAATAIRVNDALALGRALGIPGTPGMVMGRTIVVGALDEDALSQLLALEQARGFPGCS